MDAAVADQPDIQVRVFYDGECASHRVIDPSVSITKCPTAQPGQQHGIRAADDRLLGRSQQGGFVGGLENQSCERFPCTIVGSVNRRTGSAEQNACETIRRGPFRHVGDLDVAMQTDGELSAKSVAQFFGGIL